MLPQMTDRKKAQDIFNESEFLFSRKTSFTEAFPEIEDIQVEVKFTGAGIRSWNQTRHLTKESLGEFVNCQNPVCYGGGFSIGEIVREMVRSRKEKFEASRGCRGYEGSPKGRRRYRSCINSFDVKVQIKYKPDATAERTST